MARGIGLHLPAVLRLLRILRYGHRRFAALQRAAPVQLRLALQSRIHNGFLAALAHDALGVPARLPLHSTRGKPLWIDPPSYQPDDHNAARWPLAWRKLDFRF